MPQKFSHGFTVMPDDIDEQGHVNNVVYLQWIQDVAVAHWTANAPAEMRQKFGWWVSRHEIDYKLPAFEGQEITSTTWVGEWKAVTCERFTEIARGGELLVRSRTVWVLIDRQTTKPARITSDIRERFT
jgi:acyl-CoA thioester hydrolase